MRIRHASKTKAAATFDDLAGALRSVTAEELRETVSAISVPRNFFANPKNNRRVGAFLLNQFEELGFEAFFQGEWRNVIALPENPAPGPLMLIGAHYDSVPGTPGADDNASGVAAMLACARLAAIFRPELPVMFAAFNREEDGLIGSTDFVVNHLPDSGHEISRAHILEMVGFTSPEKQNVPSGLPISLPEKADFLGLVGNSESNRYVEQALQLSKAYVPELSAVGLKIFLRAERLFPVLYRSDHGPFWGAGIPAVMWTDTSEFRNPHYHLKTDTPETLDFDFLVRVARLVSAVVLSAEVPMS